MSKELEALRYLDEHNLNWHDNPTKKYVDIIKKALKDIDEIMSNHNCSNLSELNEKLCDYEELKFDDDLKQKKLKALEIIIEKNVDVGLLKGLINGNDETALEEYNEMTNEEELTQEEYDILEEIML